MADEHVPTYAESQAFQRTLRELTQETYLPLITDQVWLTGHPINRLYQPHDRLATAENGGLNQQMVTRRSHSVRSSSNPLQDTPKSGRSKSDKLKVRWDTDDTTVNDFVAIDAAATVDIFSLRGSSNSMYDIVSNANQDVFDSIDYRTAVMLHSDRDGMIWSIDGTTNVLKGAYDADLTYAGAPAHSAGDTFGTVVIAGQGIGVAREGVSVDFYTTAGELIVSNAMIVGISIVENSFEVELTADSNVSVMDTLDTAIDGSTVNVYLSGSRGAGFKGALGEIFKESYTAGENWFGGKDRSQTGNRHYIPQRIRVGASTVPLDKAHLDQLAQTIGIRVNHTQVTNPVLVAGLKAIDNLRDSTGDQVITNEDAVNRGDYTIGEVSVGYIHPSLGGKISLMGDSYAKEGVAYMVEPTDTSMMFAEVRGPMVVADWAQRPATTAQSAFSKFFDLAVMENKTPFMNNILRSGSIHKIE